ncbi:MAG: acyl dehydratase, partial [Pseudomonadota bacterium]
MNAVAAGAKQTYFEDIEVGFELPGLHKGPLTTMHLMRWLAATENWRRIHYDQKFAVERQKLPGLLVSGELKNQFILQLLKDWAGLEGWVWKTTCQFRAMDVVGTTLDLWAKVKRKIPSAEYGLVELELGIRDMDKRESTTGSALVALPYRGA